MPDTTFFFTPIDVRVGEEFVLREAEFDHVVNALRKSPGDPVLIANGRGTLIHAIIIDIGEEEVRCKAEQLRHPENELPVRLTVAVALIKRQRFEWMVEKLTELGAHKIQPLHTERVIRTGFRHDRLKKKAIAAMKQSERAYLPEISAPADFTEWIRSLAPDTSLAAAQNESAIRLDAAIPAKKTGELTLAIGPEGGWSPGELQNFRDRGIPMVRLGARRLRTETAAVAVTSQLSLLYETGNSK